MSATRIPFDTAVCVRDLPTALLAVETAQSLGVDPVLISEPEAGVYAGGLWWRALTDQIVDACPSAAVVAILDCGDQVGAALGAIRTGCGDLTVAAAPASLVGFAAARGVTLHPKPIRILTLGQIDKRTRSVIERFLLDKR
ncbi:MAG: hypothetical protein AAFX92_11875 [Pseudomonadota bacterium]